MYFFIWLLSIIIFLLFMSFAAKNTEIVSINYYFDFEWQAPMIVIILVCFALGAGFGYLASFFTKARKKS